MKHFRFPRLGREALQGRETWIAPMVEQINRSAGLKRVLTAYTRAVPRAFVTWVTGNRWAIAGLEHVDRVRPHQSVILVANHRTKYDMFVAAAVLFRHSDFVDRLYFPTRSNFYYEKKSGLALNLLFSGGSMWPPIFRDARGKALNATAIEQMAAVIQSEGSVLGIHPEGRRSTHEDPYTLLPAKPGLGDLIKAAPENTVVLPYFIAGLSDDFGELVRDRLAGKRDPIRLVFGEPIPVTEFNAAQESLALAQTVLDRVEALGRLDRTIVGASQSDAKPPETRFEHLSARES